MPARVPPFRTTRPERPVRIHSAEPPGGGFAPFGPAALRKAAENWQRFQSHGNNPAFPPPQFTYIPSADIGVGHDDDQSVARALLNRTDLPSCGYPTRVWFQGKDLFAELDGVPETIGKMCNTGQFRSVSAEIYPDYVTPDGKHHGPVLRRISLLGSTPPRQKGLGGLPPFVYSFAEPARAGRKAQQLAILFSEGPFNMDKAAALAVLSAAGIDVTPWQNVDDAAVIAFATYVQQQTPAPQATPVQQFAEINRAVAAAVAPIMGTLTAMNTRFASIQNDSLRQECETFAESNKKRLFGYESDPKSDKYVVPVLMKLPADVRKSMMDSIAARPEVAKFGESHADGTPGNQPNRGGDGPMNADRRQALLGHTPLGQAILGRKSGNN